MELSNKIKALPPYLFAELNKKKEYLINQGVDIIDLGVGDPDFPTPKKIVTKIKETVSNPFYHRYSPYEGFKLLREAISFWFKKRFSVSLNPEKEILILVGSKEGIAHLPLAFINPKDLVLVPSPGYPVYQTSTILAGGTLKIFPLREENNFLPQIDTLSKNAKMIFVNYPNNPTSALATQEFFSHLVNWAKKNQIIIAQDAAYSEIYFAEKPLSILQIPGAKEVAIEFHSFSKTFQMTGWRLAFAVGGEKLISGLKKIKTNIDSGQFGAIQEVGAYALKECQEEAEKTRQIYKKRRNFMVEGLTRLGFKVFPCQGTFYLWTKVPPGYNSKSFCERILEKAQVMVTPGIGFGKEGDNFFRLSLTTKDKLLKQALLRLKEIKI